MAQARTSFKDYLKVFFKRFGDDGVPDLAAQLAYYFLLSLFPFLIFTLAMLSYIDISSDQLIRLISRLVPAETTDLIESNMKNIVDVQRGGLLSFGVILTIWSASNAVNAIFRALNKAYNVEENRPFLVARGLAILLTLAMIVVIVVALILPVFGEVIGKFILSQLGVSSNFVAVWGMLRWLISFLIIVTVFACLYYFAPNKKLYWKDVLLGAVIAAVGWQVISLGFSFYVSNFGNFSAMYGSLGGIIVLMIWFYLTALTIIIGGEVNAVNKFFERQR
jgi:membrane protein